MHQAPEEALGSISRTITFGSVDGTGKLIEREDEVMEARDIESDAISSENIDSERDGDGDTASGNDVNSV